MKSFLLYYSNCFWFNMFINCLMFKGRCLTIRTIVRDFLFIFKFKHNILPLILFYEILELLRSPFFLTPYRRGANLYFLPLFVRREKQYRAAVKWFINSVNITDLGGKRILIIEKLLYRFEEILLLNSNNNSPVIIQNNSVNNIAESQVELKIIRNIDINEFSNNTSSTAVDYKWGIYKQIVKHRNYLHFRWKGYY